MHSLLSLPNYFFKSSAGNWSSKCLKRVWQQWDFLMDLLSKKFRDKKNGWILNIHSKIRWIQITWRSWLLKRENLSNEEQNSAQKRFRDARVQLIFKTRQQKVLRIFQWHCVSLNVFLLNSRTANFNRKLIRTTLSHILCTINVFSLEMEGSKPFFPR